MNIKQLKLTFLLTILLSIVGAKAFAHDIEVANSDGVTIYYKYVYDYDNIDDSKIGLEVTYRGGFLESYLDEYWGNVVIPESVTYDGKTYSVLSIAAWAFIKCSNLTSVTIPNSVTSIGHAAFQGCKSLKSITIPNSVMSIFDFAFSECSGLTSVIIPNSVTNIGHYAFENCVGLTSMTIPNSVTSLGAHVFDGCSNLISVTISNNITTIANDMFDYCSSLIAVTIPNSVTSIESGAFYKCSSLTSVTIPNSVTSISDDAFQYCSGLTSITIPNSVTSIGDDAFYGCNNLTSVTTEATEPIAITQYVFSSRANATLYVPAGSKAAYEAAEYWNEFKEIIEKEANKVKLSRTKAIMPVGKTGSLKATVYPTTLEDKSVTWKSSNKKVATVTSKGKVTAVGVGTATITCTSVATGAKATCKVTVGKVVLSKTKATVSVGKSGTLKATVYPETLEDKSVTWKSSDTEVATVTDAGKVTAVGVGTATITCTSNATGLKATCTLTVGKVVLSKSKATVRVGKSGTLKATVYPETMEDKSVSWKSSDTNVATVTSAGKVKAVSVGTATITCTSNALGLKATCKLTVTASAGTRSLGGDDDELTDIDDMDMDPAVVEPFDVYDLSGRKVLTHVTSLDGLSNGVYIINGKKVFIK